MCTSSIHLNKQMEYINPSSPSSSHPPKQNTKIHEHNQLQRCYGNIHNNSHFAKNTPYPLSNKDYYYACMAANVAKCSTMTSRHGCVATTSNGKILTTATNCIRACSKEGFVADQCSCHAEIHALRKLYYSHVQSQRKKLNIYNSKKMKSFYNKITLYIVRIWKNNKWCDSAPCEQCIKMIKILCIKRIVFTNENGQLEKHNPQYYNTTFMTTGNRSIEQNRVFIQHNSAARLRRVELAAKCRN